MKLCESLSLLGLGVWDAFSEEGLLGFGRNRAAAVVPPPPKLRVVPKKISFEVAEPGVLYGETIVIKVRGRVCEGGMKKNAEEVRAPCWGYNDFEHFGRWATDWTRYVGL